MNKKLLELLCCPACRDQPLQIDQDDFLRCDCCKTLYKIVEAIPVLLPPKLGTLHGK